MEGYNYGLPPARCIVAARSALDSPPLGTEEAQKRKRGANVRELADLPPERLIGRHRLGFHLDSKTKVHRCDWPFCTVHIERAADKEAKKDKRRRAPSPSPLMGTRGNSPVPPSPSDPKDRARTTLYCKDCWESTGTRQINLHAECWNLWHGLEECQPCE
eukprot:3444755-Prymnesium_polylepis.2